MKPNRLFHRNFTIMIVGQIMSLFGNSILRFALSLYVLDVTGSPAVFGGILALSMIPTVLLSPLGGVLADRLPRQRIMVVLDFTTGALIAGFWAVFPQDGNLAAVTAVMVILSVIQACYQPSVQASIPSLTADENLTAANGVVIQVQALATLVGPILGGILYDLLGVYPLLLCSALFFLSSAVLELFLRIPFVKKPKQANALGQLTADLKEALRFLRVEQPRLLKLLFIIAGLNLFLSALFTVGLPFLVRICLGLSAQHNGFAQAALGLGSIVGGLLSGIVLKRVSLRHCHAFLLGCALSLIPIALAFGLGLPVLSTYCVILLCLALGMCSTVFFNVAAQTFMQRQTPAGMLGKVSSFVTTICVCAFPVGQGLYGILFQYFSNQVWAVLLFGAASGVILALATGRALKGVVDHSENSGEDLSATV